MTARMRAAEAASRVRAGVIWSGCDGTEAGVLWVLGGWVDCGWVLGFSPFAVAVDVRVAGLVAVAVGVVTGGGARISVPEG